MTRTLKKLADSFQSVAELRRMYHFACAALTGLLFAATYLLLFFPLTVYFSSYEQAIRQYELQFDHLADLHQEQDELFQTREVLSDELIACLERLQAHNNQIDFMTEFEELTADCELAIDSYAPVSHQQQGELQVTTLQIELSGPYAGLCRLLERMPLMKPYLRVDSIVMTPHAQNTEVTKMVLQLSLFSLPENALATLSLLRSADEF